MSEKSESEKSTEEVEPQKNRTLEEKEKPANAIVALELLEKAKPEQKTK